MFNLHAKKSHLTFSPCLLKSGDKQKSSHEKKKAGVYEPWLNETYQIHSSLVSQVRQNGPRPCVEKTGTGEVKILLHGHSHFTGALVIEQR